MDRRRFFSLGGLALAGASLPSQLLGQDFRNPKVWLGIDRCERESFRVLRGKRIGLLTHPAGVNRIGKSTVEVLFRSPLVNLTALFGPEHGIYGDEMASQPVEDKIDHRTGLPVYSLYGKYRKPTPGMLAQIDALVIDLQDIGTRSYTFTSCMRYAMEACFENGVEVVILDRPNPLGGVKVDGPPMDRELMSYVGAFQVPYVHGLTIGELARMSVALPGWMAVEPKVQSRGKLTVIPMSGWSRADRWPTTGLNWVPTSPFIPDLPAVLGYPMTGLGGQLGGFSHGIGTPHPFRLLRHQIKTPMLVHQALAMRSIPGLSFERVTSHTTKVPSRSVSGVYVKVRDWSRLRPTELSFHLMVLSANWDNNPFRAAPENEALLYNKHFGSMAWWEEITERGPAARVGTFVEQWTRQAIDFQQFSQRFWLYR